MAPPPPTSVPKRHGDVVAPLATSGLFIGGRDLGGAKPREEESVSAMIERERKQEKYERRNEQGETSRRKEKG